jgi:beta-lactamase family protein/polyglycine hydrolase-like protein
VHVSATGGGTSMRISAIFEQRSKADATEITIDQDEAAFRNELTRRIKTSTIPRTATIYDGATHNWRVTAIWEKNTANVAWTINAGMTSAEHQTQFETQFSAWARPSFVTGSTTGRMLAIYRDDQIGPIGQGFVPRHNQTKESFESEYALWFGKGFHIVCLQGYGAGDARRFAAIFVNNETPVQRTVRITGTPAVTAIDNAVIDLMKRSNIRGASLAIVKGTRLVLARGYTWAEPDYPAVQPTTTFRLASCSKLITALGIHQLAAEGIIDLEAPLPSVLPLTTVSGGTPTTAPTSTEPSARFSSTRGASNATSG